MAVTRLCHRTITADVSCGESFSSGSIEPTKNIVKNSLKMS
jgi:hypothetical protein